MLLYLQDERIDLNKLRQDIEQITYENFEINLIVTKKITEKQGYNELSNMPKVKSSTEIETKDIIKTLNQLIVNK